jgi:DNA/RNA endonuclease YhcR with UshA esterase domain
MVQLACAAGSSTCATTSNSILKTTNAPHEYTGLSAVTVSNAQDWRIFYHDNSSFLSQVEGNLSGFKSGERVGGAALNGSSIAAVNVNTTTNNINVFYVDQLTQALTYQQFTDGAWTVGTLPFQTSF